MREFLVFSEEVRDILLDSDPTQVTSVTRRLLKERGQTMLQDAERKFAAGIIAERELKIIAVAAKHAS